MPKREVWIRHVLSTMKYFPANIAELWEQTEEVEIPEIPVFKLAVLSDFSPRPENTTFVLTPKQEKFLFIKYNYTKSMLVNFAKQDTPYGASQVRRIMSLWKEQRKLESDIINANIALALMFTQRYEFARNMDLSEVIGEGIESVMRSARRFDPSRGFKFSTYACNAIIRQFSRLRKNHTKQNSRYKQFSEKASFRDFKETPFQQTLRKDQIQFVRRLIDENPAKLNEQELIVVNQRWLGDEKQKFGYVADKLGVSKQRVQQIEKQAMFKLREYIQTEDELNGIEPIRVR